MSMAQEKSNILKTSTLSSGKDTKEADTYKKKNRSLIQKCFYNKKGICHFLECDLVPCHDLCANFTSFDNVLKTSINKKIKNTVNRLGKNDPVDKYRLDIAFGFTPENDNIQGVL